MNSILKITSSLAVAAIISGATVLPAFAQQGDVMRIRGEGFRACKAMGNSGYTGIVRGTLLNGGSNTYYSSGFARFNIRYCFASRTECTRFVGRIENLVRAVNTVDYRACLARG